MFIEFYKFQTENHSDIFKVNLYVSFASPWPHVPVPFFLVLLQNFCSYFIFLYYNYLLIFYITHIIA